jgi:exopolysaccharide biosynthesis WecB/TagA/CpsF family protein
VTAQSESPIPSVWIGGMKITTASRADLVTMALDDCQRFRGNPAAWKAVALFDANGHALSLRKTDPAYREAVDRADITHADGGFLVTVSRWKSPAKIKQRSATTDMIHDFASACKTNGASFYLLGGTEEVNFSCHERLKEMYPGLSIVGRRNGYFSPDEEGEIVSEINELQPDFLWVGLGKPKEQIFTIAHRESLSVGWIITCGGCFNYITEHYGRAPMWMQKMNLEWLYRAFSDRGKFFWRYVTTSPRALWLALSENGS